MAVTTNKRISRCSFTPGAATVVMQPKRRYRRHIRPFTTTAERELLAKAAGILGLTASPESLYGRKVVRLAARRSREGYTDKNLIAVARYAVRRWKAGDHWSSWKDLLYLWGVKFPALLASSKALKDGMHFTDQDPEEWGRKLVEQRGRTWK